MAFNPENHVNTAHQTEQFTAPLTDEDRMNLQLIQQELSSIPDFADEAARVAEEDQISQFVAELDNKEAVLTELRTWIQDQGEQNPNRTWMGTWLDQQSSPEQPAPASGQSALIVTEWNRQSSGLMAPSPTRINGREVRQTPSLESQMVDNTRTNYFKFNRIGGETRQTDVGAEIMTEQEGLFEIYELLSDYLANFSPHQSGPQGSVYRRISGLMQNLNFVGGVEYHNGAIEIGREWKAFLDKDANRQICVPALISHCEKYTRTKSDTYFKDRVLSTFTDAELDQYSGRIVGEIEDITAKPDDVLFVMADDWSISGNQMERAFGEMIENKKFKSLVQAGSIAVHSLIAPPERLRNGLLINTPRGRRIRLPMFAPYVARVSDSAESNARAHISGTHSVVNYDFEDLIEKKVVRSLNEIGQPTRLPALTNVVSPYKYQAYTPTILVSPDKLERRR
jgi:hypothetical protein